MCVYLYCRISRKTQSIERQVRNLTSLYPQGITGRKPCQACRPGSSMILPSMYSAYASSAAASASSSEAKTGVSLGVGGGVGMGFGSVQPASRSAVSRSGRGRLAVLRMPTR